jgi:hypothetical protein
LESYYSSENCKFDALNIDEKYNSLEEKKRELLKAAKESFRAIRVKDFWSGISVEAYEELVKKYLYDFNYKRYKEFYNFGLMLNFGFIKL